MTRRHFTRNIVITGDVLRPTEEKFVASQSGNIRWLYMLLRGVIGRATNKSVEIRTWEDCNIQQFYREAGAKTDIRGWGELSDRLDRSEVIDSWVRINYGNSFVIGFEMPRILSLNLSRVGIPYINLTIHPVRFLSDIYFGMSTNHPEIYSALNDYAIPEQDIQRGAELVLAHVAKRDLPLPDGPTALILGQVRYDRALICNGKFVTFADHGAALREHVERESYILFKRHPYATSDLNLYLCGIPLHKIRTVVQNFYELMGSEGIAKVVSLTSGGSYEARYFGKVAVHLGEMPTRCVARNSEYSAESHLGVFEGFLDEDFWRAVCSPVMDVTKPDGYRYRRPPNTLRVALGDFWGFNQITTDRIVALAHR